jgi:hypothetical protein
MKNALERRGRDTLHSSNETRTVLRVVLSVLHSLQCLSHIKFRLRGEQHKRFKTWRSAGEMGPIYDVNPRYKTEFHAHMQQCETFCIVHTLIALFKFRNL